MIESIIKRLIQSNPEQKKKASKFYLIKTILL